VANFNSWPVKSQQWDKDSIYSSPPPFLSWGLLKHAWDLVSWIKTVMSLILPLNRRRVGRRIYKPGYTCSWVFLRTHGLCQRTVIKNKNGAEWILGQARTALLSKVLRPLCFGEENVQFAVVWICNAPHQALCIENLVPIGGTIGKWWKF
jgi:hypothetical protein